MPALDSNQLIHFALENLALSHGPRAAHSVAQQAVAVNIPRFDDVPLHCFIDLMTGHFQTAQS
jgi:hypothetical protein